MERADVRLHGISRREFAKAATASGIALTLTRLAVAENLFVDGPTQSVRLR